MGHLPAGMLHLCITSRRWSFHHNLRWPPDLNLLFRRFFCNIIFVEPHSGEEDRKWVEYASCDDKRSMHNFRGDGRIMEALGILEKGMIEMSRNDAYCLLQECIRCRDLVSGRRVQLLMIQKGFHSVSILGAHLIRLFSVCQCLDEANQAFQSVLQPNTHSWSAVISAHINLGSSGIALELYFRIPASDVLSKEHVYVGGLKASSLSLALVQGRLIHEEVIQNRDQCDIFVENALVDMYMKCGTLKEAEKVFDKMSNRDVISWSTMIAGYVQHGLGLLALECFSNMQFENVKPSIFTFSSILKACGTIGAIEHGRYIHMQIDRSGLHVDAVIEIALLDMYAKCKSFKEACQIFNRLPNKPQNSWSALISGYSECDEGVLAIECFCDMQAKGVKADTVTFSSVLKACGNTGAAEYGRLFHEQINGSGIYWDVVLWDAILDMYMKCECFKEARQIFDNLPNPDEMSWGIMISGYAKHGEGLNALECFDEMQLKGIEPNKGTFQGMLKACGIVGAVKQGKKIHEQIIKHGFHMDPGVGITIVDMYAKCGCFDDAVKVFNELPDQNVVAWGSLIAGYAQCANSKLALQWFDSMLQKGIKPNEIIFSSLFAACSHAGLVNEGREYFKSMKEDHGIVPDICHYSGMVDLLSRAGCLNEAKNLLTLQPDVCGWTSLLTACRTYGNVELGNHCFNQVIQLDPVTATGHMLMSGIYANAGMWEDAKKLEEERKCGSIWKKPAKAWTEVNDKVHEFIVGDRLHPQSNEIFLTLKDFQERMKIEGYIPQENILHQMLNQDWEQAFSRHCERLAIAFNIISTSPGATIRVTKNLRVCMECHAVTKFISKFEKREIIIRDPCRIHHFKDGFCSCGDYH